MHRQAPQFHIRTCPLVRKECLRSFWRGGACLIRRECLRCFWRGGARLIRMRVEGLFVTMVPDDSAVGIAASGINALVHGYLRGVPK